MAQQRRQAYRSRAAVEAGDAARGETDAANVASTVKTDAVTAGLVHGGDRYKGTARASSRLKASQARQRKAGAADADTAGAKDCDAKAASNGEGVAAEGGRGADSLAYSSEEKSRIQRSRHLKAAIVDWAAGELDDSEELEGVDGMRRDGQAIVRAASAMRERRLARMSGTDSTVSGTKTANGASRAEAATFRKTASSNNVAAPKSNAQAPRAASGTRAAKGSQAEAQSAKRIQQRRGWLSARAAQEQAGTASGAARSAQAAKAAATTRRAAGAKTLAAAAGSAAAPAAGVLAGVLCFVLSALLVGQMVSSLFGFWDNEARKVSLEGLPPYITAEMVEAALECQEKYGHPAGCTIAQIICESGMGDHLSGLATQDRNLFGIKWAGSFLGCPEVSGKSAWSTQEEYGGVLVTIMDDFTSFNSYTDCIKFRSRVLLANSRYADNALIKEAIATKSSDKMAEGLKDAGYATSSAYVSSLKSALDTYNLRRFDGLSLTDYKKGVANGNKVLEAAMSQLGVPYVWGGTTPGVGLDCSGLTQWCYAQAGVSIPRNSENQAAAGRKVPLSEAKPGDILWRPGHVALYVGGDEYIHEPQTGDVCRKATGIAYFTCAVRF